MKTIFQGKVDGKITRDQQYRWVDTIKRLMGFSLAGFTMKKKRQNNMGRGGTRLPKKPHGSIHRCPCSRLRFRTYSI